MRCKRRIKIDYYSSGTGNWKMLVPYGSRNGGKDFREEAL